MNTCHVCARKYKLDLEFCPHCGAMNLELDEAPKVRKTTLSFGQDDNNYESPSKKPEETTDSIGVQKEESNKIRRTESKTLEEILSAKKDKPETISADSSAGDTKKFTADEMRAISAAQKTEDATSKVIEEKPAEARKREEVETPKTSKAKPEAVKPVKPVKTVENQEKIEEYETPRSKEDWSIEPEAKEEESSAGDFFVELWASIQSGAAVAGTSIKTWAVSAGSSIKNWSSIAWTKIKEWSSVAGVKIKEWTNTTKDNFNEWNEERKAQAEIRREEREKEEAARLEAEQIRLEEEARIRAEEEARAEEERIRLAEEEALAEEERERIRLAELERSKREQEEYLRRTEEERERIRLAELERAKREQEEYLRRTEEERERIRLAEIDRARRAEEQRIRRLEEERILAQEAEAREAREQERADREAREQERLRLAKEAYENELRNSRATRDNSNYAAAASSRDYYDSVDDQDNDDYEDYEDNYDREYTSSSRQENRVLNNVSWSSDREEQYSNTYQEEVEEDDQYEDENIGIWGRITSAFTNGIEWLLVRLRPVHIVGIVGVIALAVVIFIWSNSGSPVKNFERALAERNYEQAGELYSSYENRDELLGLANDELQEHLDQLLDNAAAGNTSYAATYSAIEVINDSGLYQGEAQTILDETIAELGRLQEVNIVYDNAVDSENYLDFESAIEGYNRVLETYPNYRDASSRLATSRQSYREQVLRDVNSLQSQGNYQEANTVLDRALELIPDDPIFTNMKENNLTQSDSALYSEASAEAERYFQAGNYEEMFNVIDSAIVLEPDNDTLKELRAEYEFQSAEAILNTADSMFIQGDKEGALERIDFGLELIPNNEMLTEAQERYELDLEDDGENGDTTDDEDGVSLGRNEYMDVAGNVHTDSVLVEHSFTGSTDVVETFRVNNETDGDSFIGEIAIGQVDQYTQVYYQVYSSSNLAAPLYQGSLYANADDAGETYRVQIDANASNAEYFIINLNYLRGNQIQVILDLEFE